jgi:ubiquinone/menaquinone biosynthesis C-methylase UbiE
MMNIDQAISLIKKSKLYQLEKLNDKVASEADIVNYYADSYIGYRLFHSYAGAIHMAISPSSKVRSSDFLNQAKLVASHIDQHHPQRVLELAFGTGYNTAYLAKNYPGISFSGIDLTPTHVHQAQKRARKLPNTTFQLGNFEKLPYPDHSFDLIFVIESLCHASNMEHALLEISRVLNLGGQLIVIDGYRNDHFDRLASNVKSASRLVEAAMALNVFYEITNWEQLGKQQGFKIINHHNLTEQIMPNTVRLYHWANFFFHSGLLAHLLAKIFSPLLIQNAIAGLLMPLTIKAGAHSYYAITLQKE